MSPRGFFDDAISDLEQAERSVREALRLARDVHAREPHQLTDPVNVALCRLDNIVRNLPRVKL